MAVYSMTYISYIPHMAGLSTPSFSRPHKPTRGYQWRPCHCTSAPGGSDRYPPPMTAGSFCIRKAILIYEPINTHTGHFTSVAPPTLLGCFFFLVCIVRLVTKAPVKFWSLSSGHRHSARLHEGSVGHRGVLSWRCLSLPANQTVLRPPAERMTRASCFSPPHPEVCLCPID